MNVIEKIYILVWSLFNIIILMIAMPFDVEESILFGTFFVMAANNMDQIKSNLFSIFIFNALIFLFIWILSVRPPSDTSLNSEGQYVHEYHNNNSFFDYSNVESRTESLGDGQYMTTIFSGIQQLGLGFGNTPEKSQEDARRQYEMFFKSRRTR